MTSYKTLNERICTVRVRDRFLYNICAPAEEKKEDIKNQFYESCERTYDEIPGISMLK
jgi:hypothetical protein